MSAWVRGGGKTPPTKGAPGQVPGKLYVYAKNGKVASVRECLSGEAMKASREDRRAMCFVPAEGRGSEVWIHPKSTKKGKGR